MEKHQEKVESQMWNSSRQAGEIGENTGKDRETPGKSGEPHFPPFWYHAFILRYVLSRFQDFGTTY